MWTPAGIKSPTSGKQPLAKKLSTVMENLSFSWSWERLALFTLAATVVAIFQKPFLRRRQRRPVCQSAILLPASHDTIGHYWTSGSVVQQSPTRGIFVGIIFNVISFCTNHIQQCSTQLCKTEIQLCKLSSCDTNVGPQIKVFSFIQKFDLMKVLMFGKSSAPFG